MGYRVVVAGATGNVGREMLNILAEREFPVDEIAVRRLVARRRATRSISARPARSSRSRISSISIPTGWDMALFAIGSEATKIYAPKFAAAGCTVIDNSSLYRMDPDVPLIVPEVNPEAIDGYTTQQHHRQPQLLDRADGRRAEAAARCREDQARRRRDLSVGLRRGQGRDGRAVRAEPQHLRRRSAPRPKKFTKQIAFNVIPHIDSFLDDGSTKEEWKMVVETKKILDPEDQGRPRPACACRCSSAIREAINIEFENEISAEEAQNDPARGARRHARR